MSLYDIVRHIRVTHLTNYDSRSIIVLGMEVRK